MRFTFTRTVTESSCQSSNRGEMSIGISIDNYLKGLCDRKLMRLRFSLKCYDDCKIKQMTAKKHYQCDRNKILQSVIFKTHYATLTKRLTILWTSQLSLVQCSVVESVNVEAYDSPFCALAANSAAQFTPRIDKWLQQLSQVEARHVVHLLRRGPVSLAIVRSLHIAFYERCVGRAKKANQTQRPRHGQCAKA